MQKAVNITISGLVQGVSFRYYARDKANSLGVTGFIKNMSNSNVYIEAQAEEKKLQEFLDWCRSGSDMANVRNIDVVEAEPRNFSNFEIKY